MTDPDFSHLAELHTLGDENVPEIVVELAAGRSADLVWRNDLGGLTFCVEDRAQGATYQRAHVLAAAGRELAYVALSRARDHTAVYATADDLAQAVDDLHVDWGVEHHQRWITDTPARIGHEPDPAEPGHRPRNPSRRRCTGHRSKFAEPRPANASLL